MQNPVDLFFFLQPIGIYPEWLKYGIWSELAYSHIDAYNITYRYVIQLQWVGSEPITAQKNFKGYYSLHYIHQVNDRFPQYKPPNKLACLIVFTSLCLITKQDISF